MWPRSRDVCSSIASMRIDDIQRVSLIKLAFVEIDISFDSV